MRGGGGEERCGSLEGENREKLGERGKKEKKKRRRWRRGRNATKTESEREGMSRTRKEGMLQPAEKEARYRKTKVLEENKNGFNEAEAKARERRGKKRRH